MLGSHLLIIVLVRIVVSAQGGIIGLAFRKTLKHSARQHLLRLQRELGLHHRVLIEFFGPCLLCQDLQLGQAFGELAPSLGRLHRAALLFRQGLDDPLKLRLGHLLGANSQYDRIGGSRRGLAPGQSGRNQKQEGSHTFSIAGHFL